MLAFARGEPLLSPHSFTRAASRIILAVAFASLSLEPAELAPRRSSEVGRRLYRLYRLRRLGESLECPLVRPRRRLSRFNRRREAEGDRTETALLLALSFSLARLSLRSGCCLGLGVL